MPDEVVVIQTTEEDVVVVESAAEPVIVEDAGEDIFVEAPDQFPNPRIIVSQTPPVNPEINTVWIQIL